MKSVDAKIPGYSGARHRRSRVSPALLLIFGVLLSLAAALLLLRPLYRALHPMLPKKADAIRVSPANGTQSAVEPSAAAPSAAPTSAPPARRAETPLLVNDAHPLPAEYTPDSLVCLNDLDATLFTVQQPNTYAAPEAADALILLLTAAHRDGLTVWQVSEGYRSVADQQRIWDEKYEKYRTVNGLSEKKAQEAVARRVARPGCSEHHTGLSLDLSVPGAAFRKTPQSEWLANHCHEYGFIIRYTEEKERLTGITAEPWHIRYVGVEAAQRMKEENWCLEEYIQNIQRKL